LLALIAFLSAAALGVASRSLATGNRPPPHDLPVLVVDPNFAPASVLEALPHIGPSLVKQMTEQRRIRPFRSTEDLRRRVRGLGPLTLARLAPHLRIAASEIAAADSDLPRNLLPAGQTDLAQAPQPRKGGIP
jgi:competence protein ComEA